jgi:hypothetical protein
MCKLEKDDKLTGIISLNCRQKRPSVTCDQGDKADDEMRRFGRWYYVFYSGGIVLGSFLFCVGCAGIN